jgi:hypothetical protein
MRVVKRFQTADSRTPSVCTSRYHPSPSPRLVPGTGERGQLDLGPEQPGSARLSAADRAERGAIRRRLMTVERRLAASALLADAGKHLYAWGRVPSSGRVVDGDPVDLDILGARRPGRTS